MVVSEITAAGHIRTISEETVVFQLIREDMLTAYAGHTLISEL